ncbi:hypothetical protein LPB41_01525 [Thalassospira sp. MA62]|nr:hypothetical protein [Thalassospira sp. MA62]
MTVEPEVQALEIVKKLDALCDQAQGAIKQTDALLAQGGVSREDMDKAFAKMPAEEQSKSQALLAADLEEIERDVNAARQHLGQATAKTSTSVKRMRRMI